MGQVFAVYGASGFGREVMPIARAQLIGNGISTGDLFFVDDNPRAHLINGQRVLSYIDFLSLPASERYAVFAISDSYIRERLALKCLSDGIQPWTIEAGNIVLMDSVELGWGGILCPFVTITSNICIGCHFHANIYSYVAHDCIIGDYVTFGPAVKCNGNIVVEDHVYIGAGAVIKQGRSDNPIRIGRGAVIGMGAVVTKNVLPGEVLVGNPARPIAKR